MTIISATCAIGDELVDSGSFLRTQVSACGDMHILDGAPACAVTVHPGLSRHTRIGYGGVRLSEWGFAVRGWIKYRGNVEEALRNVSTMHDSLVGALVGGSIANCASLDTWVNTTSFDPDHAWNFGGPDYLLVTANVTAKEDP